MSIYFFYYMITTQMAIVQVPYLSITWVACHPLKTGEGDDTLATWPNIDTRVGRPGYPIQLT